MPGTEIMKEFLTQEEMSLVEDEYNVFLEATGSLKHKPLWKNENVQPIIYW